MNVLRVALRRWLTGVEIQALRDHIDGLEQDLQILQTSVAHLNILSDNMYLALGEGNE